MPYQLVVCVCISRAYRQSDPPAVVRTDSTQGVAMSVALFSVKDICTVESLSTPCLGMLGSFSGSVLAGVTQKW